MHHYCTIQNIMYLCNCNHKGSDNQAAGACQSPAKTIFPDIKKAGITGIPAGKKKDKTFFCFVAKTKIRFSFRS